jgi:Na+/glutamate symporter
LSLPIRQATQEDVIGRAGVLQKLDSMKLSTITTTIAVILMFGFVITANAYTWGKPYTPAIVAYVPWWSWAMLVAAIVMEITRECLERNK